MRRFRFRAQAALDLRHREDDEAKRAYALAERDLFAAVAGLQDAEARVNTARETLAAVMSAPSVIGEEQWHRSWILKLDQERRACAVRVTACQELRVKRHAERLETHTRVDALERFKETAATAHARAEDAETQKSLDELGTMRFVSRARAM